MEKVLNNEYVSQTHTRTQPMINGLKYCAMFEGDVVGTTYPILIDKMGTPLTHY